MSHRWEPHQYLKYRGERTRPSADLAAGIAQADPRDVLDVGCGPGNSREVLRRRRPSARVVGVDYYDLLCRLCRSVDLWETTYFHEMAGHRDPIEWYRGTGMKPYLQRLPDGGAREEFMAEVLERCRDSYRPQADGTVLYPFRRLFFIASPLDGKAAARSTR